MIEVMPKLSICCLAYNHEFFIRKCLDGFMMQKTDFPFEVLIHDDASTDNTPQIIREYQSKYPDIIKPIFQKENQYSKGIWITGIHQLPRAKGKYIAFCEGDDYWTDPYKLQKQVDFLETHPDYSLCCHRYQVFDKEENSLISEVDIYQTLLAENPEGVSFNLEDNFLKYWLTKVFTTVIRRKYINLDVLSKFEHPRDVHLFYYILKSGKGFCMNFVGGVYNKHFGGVYSKTTDKESVNYQVFKDLYKRNLNDGILKKVYRANLLHIINADVLNHEIRLTSSLQKALEPVFIGDGVKTSLLAVCRIFRDRLWRIKNAMNII